MANVFAEAPEPIARAAGQTLWRQLGPPRPSSALTSAPESEQIDGLLFLLAFHTDRWPAAMMPALLLRQRLRMRLQRLQVCACSCGSGCICTATGGLHERERCHPKRKTEEGSSAAIVGHEPRSSRPLQAQPQQEQGQCGRKSVQNMANVAANLFKTRS